jgi:transposase-like protein
MKPPRSAPPAGVDLHLLPDWEPRFAGLVATVRGGLVGGIEAGVSGRQTFTKAIVVIAVEAEPGRRLGRVRLARVIDMKATSLLPFVRANVERGSVVHTDGWGAYKGLPLLGYTHTVTNIAASGVPAHVEMPAVHLVASHLDRWWLGTHHGAIRRRFLDFYLDEFVFRFNRRSSKARGLLFYRLLQQAVATEPVPYASLVGGRP